MTLKRQLLLVGVDILILLASIVTSSVLRLGIHAGSSYLETHAASFVVSTLVYVILLYVAGQYDVRKDYGSLPQSLTLLGVSVGAFVLSTVFFYVDWSLKIGRGIYLLNVGLVTAGIWLWRRLYCRLIAQPLFQRRALLLGLSRDELPLVKEMTEVKASGIQFIGALVDQYVPLHDERDGIPILGDLDSLEKVLLDEPVEVLVASNGTLSRQDVCQQLFIQERQGKEAIHIADLYETLTGKVPIRYVSDQWLHLGVTRSRIYGQRIKGLIDRSVALLAIVLLVPLALLIMVGIALTSRGGIFYVQERLGAGGRKFKLLKFRTMVDDAEQESGPVWAAEDDRRITPFGRLLRRWRLDEIPQFVNVLLGDMSLVGPRPERELFIRRFQDHVPIYRRGRRRTDTPGAEIQTGWQERIPLYSLRFAVKPGLTGWAQINHPYAASMEESLEKFVYDLFYIKHLSLLLDSTILAKSVWVVLSGNGR